MRSRFAPSPTGPLHLGNARTALLAYWHARSQGGSFIVRVEDLDTQRSKPACAEANLAELRWLGLEWDEGPDVGGPYAPYRQSERFAFYEGALERLEPYLFECYLSRKDMRELASAPHARASVYGDHERHLNETLSAQKRAGNKAPSLRFRAPDKQLSFRDEVRGVQHLGARRDVGDIIVRRADGEWAYQLAVVVDDIAMKISHVLRGDDLLPSTGAQLLLYNALGAAPPSFAHVPLLLDTDGTRMAKRKGSLTLSALDEAGVRPERVVGLLALSLGLLPKLVETQARELTPSFSLENVSRRAFSLDAAAQTWLFAR